MLKFREGIDVKAINAAVYNGLTKHLDIVIYEMGDDWLKAKMPVSDNHKQPFGLLHGGASVVMAETLGSIASFMMIDESKYNVVGIEVNAQHLRSTSGGYVYAHAKPVHTGRKIHVWQIDITDDNDRLICIAKLSAMIVEKQ
ncbi:MAG: 1,4-dihydroxy-2-naphthoyl-CoA hydrolase [Patiriisocius sp.]|jgi:1,4-dihydroxy-2-naphthoyl-CoA hydrolase